MDSVIGHESNQSIQTVILAAGRGSRLASAIHNRPKCLSDVGGRALIDHQLSLLTEAGIRRICVVTGYRADEVREAVGAQAELIHNKAWAEINSLYSFWLCRDWVSSALLVINCDVLFHAEVLYRLLTCPGNAFAYDFSSGTEEEHTKVEIDEDAALMSMSKTLPTYRSQGENAGLLYFDKRAARLLFREVEALLQRGGQQMWVTAAVQEVANYIAMRAIDIADLPWVEIDFSHDLNYPSP
jgi:choline kinase